MKLITLLILLACSSATWAHGLQLDSKAAVVYDLKTNKVLYEKNANTAHSIASISKLMMATVLLESHPNLNEKIKITDDDVDRLKHSESRLPVGSVLTRQKALLLALMSSENRAAHALARTSKYGLSGFIARMNQTAHLLGMRSTQYHDPAGLDPRNQASPEDLAKLVKYDARFDLIHRFTTHKKEDVELGHRNQVFHNTNPFVMYSRYPIELQKTGYITEAGRCMVLKVRLPQRHLLIVLEGASSEKSRTRDALKIFNAFG